MKRRIRGVFTPKILLPLLAVGAVGFGAVGVMSLLERRGEAAISMIPADAALAISFDNTPSPSQVMLFKEISDAMEDSGMNRYVDEMMDDMGVPPEVRAIKDNLKGSFAVGIWGDIASAAPDMILAAAMEDTTAAENIVKQHGKRLEGVSAPAYQLEQDVVVAFHNGYALVTNKADNLQRALDASENKIQSLDEAASYKRARESLPADASFMLFANGEAIARADEDTRKMYEAIGIKKAGWAAVGATILDTGIQVDMYQDMQDAGELTAAYEAIPELTYSSASKLPSGAIGVLGISDAGRMIGAIVESMEVSELGTEIGNGMTEMEKETGLSFKKDFLPALAGETYMALYPPKGADNDEPTFVLMFDEQNGATPESAARKLIAKVDEFTSKKVGEAEVFAAKEGEPVIAILPDQVAITNDLSIVSGNTSNGLTGTGSLAKFDEGAPAKFKLQIDLRKLFATIREFAGDDVPALEQALSQDSLECSWTVEDGVSKGRALIPLKILELIRMAGKELQKHKSAPEQSMEGVDAEAFPAPDMKENVSKDELLARGRQIGVALQMYAKDNDGKYPLFQEFMDGAIDPYLKDKSIDKDFVYMPPLKDVDPATSEVGFFMADDGRVVVFQDGNAKYESSSDWGDEPNRG